MNGTKVAIVADDQVFAAALAAALAADGLDVAGVVRSPRNLDRLLQPGDIAIYVDQPLGPMGSAPGVRGIVLFDGDADEMLDAIAAGATGVVEADATFAEIAQGVRDVADGHAVIPPVMLGALLHSVVERRRREREAREVLTPLTPREREVFELMATGRDRDEIAERLFISPATARTHLQRVYAKLDIHSKAEAVALAARCGLDVEEP
jgi:DNA-binding CsgD family transcriptional regulator